MINHHPADDLLLNHVSGTLSTGPSLVVASHVEGCGHCQGRVALLEMVGGALLDEIEPVALTEGALATALAGARRVGHAPRGSTLGGARAAQVRARPDLPDGVAWPTSLQDCNATPWRWLGPGMRWSRVSVPRDRRANVFLLRIGAGKRLPMHTHSDCELTQILYGNFHDGRALFGAGDFDEADVDILHQPVVQPGGECICLAAVSGKVLFQGAVARMFGSMVGM